jgi:2-(3-amino-3-carboxypropyl)histidine synthase
MKTLFIEAKYKRRIKLNKKIIKKLPENIGLVTTLQFVDQLKDIKKILDDNNKKSFIGKGKQKYSGQILGCDYSSALKIKNKVNAFFYIGSGEFHPLGLALKTKKQIYYFNPLNNNFYKINKNDIIGHEKRLKGSYIKFLHSEIIGILVSIKPGQNKLYDVFELKKKLEKQRKKVYIFIFNTLNFNELENFPFIECWVNTACPRIYDDKDKIKKPLINIEDIF